MIQGRGVPEFWRWIGCIVLGQWQGATHPWSATFCDSNTPAVPSFLLAALVTSIRPHWHLLKGTHSHLIRPILDLGKRGPCLGPVL